MQGLSVPLGCVLPYAGNLKFDQLREIGWSACDGSQLPIQQNDALYQLIRNCNGGDGSTYFNLPDYRGRFLRGVDYSGDVDRGAFMRTAAAPGGATGANVGSVEDYATGAPNNGFSASIPHLPTSEHNAYYGSNAQMLEPGGGQTFNSLGGGDAETRPTNAYVNFIIKIDPNAGIPIGTIFPFAGGNGIPDQPISALYLLCDGAYYVATQLPELYKAIGTSHGGIWDEFYLPDYRGYFLRGADAGVNRDPDTLTRYMMQVGGSTGDAVGSVQDYATALPAAPYTIQFNLGTGEMTSDHCLGHDNSMWNPGAVQIALTAAGGDHESRPVNVYVDHYILAFNDPNEADICPIGAVIGFPGEVAPSPAEWLLCDGSSFNTSGKYANLFAAIGTANGGGGDSFNVPDYRGYFLRGTDHGVGRDPDSGSRTSVSGGAKGDATGSIQSFATGRPKKADIYTNVPHIPTADADTAGAISGGSAAEWDGGATPAVGGGDPETRPINANIFFYIKWAHASPQPRER